jgi:penicillin-binding protein 2
MLFFDQLSKSDRYLWMLSLIIAAGLGVLLTGLWYVQVVSRHRYMEDQTAQSFRSVRVPAIRGKILDRDGNALAENRPSYNVNVYLEELSKNFRTTYSILLSNETVRLVQTENRKLTREERGQLENTARYLVTSNIVNRLGRLLDQPLILGWKEFQRHYHQKLALPLPAMRELSSLQLARLQEQTGIPTGLDLDVQPLRNYPYGKTAAHILGYLTKDDSPKEGEESFYNYRLPDFRGVVGVEAFYDEMLRGRAGAKSVLVNNLGYRQSENIWNPVEPGKNLVLTLDVRIQQAVEKALLHPGPQGNEVPIGAAVVMDINTGDILAIASTPSYNPNQFIPSITQDDMTQLTDPYLRPLRNRASQEIYMPGSIFKIITGLACLEAGVMNPEDILHSPGYAQIGRTTIKDTAAAGEYNFKRAFIKSSNTYFIYYGLKAGLDAIQRMGEQFHLGDPVELPTLQSSKGFFPTRDGIRKMAANGEYWNDGDTANLCIGQGQISVNVVQMAVMISAVANGGKVFWPRLVQRIEPVEVTGDPNEITQFPTRLRNELPVHPRNLQIIREAMLADVEDPEGSGRSAATPGTRVSGKTGTAENKQGNKLVDKTTWFASFAPYETPKYAVVVMYEKGSAGGTTCAPVASQIYRAIFSRPVPKTESLAMVSNLTVNE